MLKVYSNHSIIQYVDYMRGAPGAVTPFTPYKIHHWSKLNVKLNEKHFAQYESQLLKK